MIDPKRSEKAQGKSAHAEEVATATLPRSVSVASRGLYTGAQYAEFLSELARDVMLDEVTEKKANAVCNIAGKQFKLAELNHKYGTPEGQDKTLFLSKPSNGESATAEIADMRTKLAAMEARLKDTAA